MQIRTVEDRLDGRNDGDVIAEHREILDSFARGLQDSKSRRRHRGFKAKAEEHDLAAGILSRQRQRVHRRIDHPDIGAVGLGLQQALARTRNPHGVAEGRENHFGCSAIAMQSSTRPIGKTQTGQPGPCTSSMDLRQQSFHAIAEDRMGVAAADLHDLMGWLSVALMIRRMCAISLQRTSAFARREIRQHISRGGLLGCRRSTIIGEQRMHKIPQNVVSRDVALLYPVNRRTRHNEAIIADTGGRHFATVSSRKTDRNSPISLALAKAAIRLEEFPLVEISDQAIACFALRNDLASENMLEPDVITNRRNHRKIRDEIESGERRAAGSDGMHEFNRDVRCIAA